MRISLEEIRAGRRRDWDKLKDPEVRREEERARQEADPEYKKKLTAQRQRDDAREEEKRRDAREWIRAKRQSIAIVGICALLVLGYWGYRLCAWAIDEHRYARKLAEVQEVLTSGVPYSNFETPLDAWASWKDAWRRHDGEALWKMNSPAKAATSRNRDPIAMMVTFAHQIRSGKQEASRSIPLRFGVPQRVFIAPHPWRTGDLAVFRSEPLRRETVTEPPMEWVVAFSYDSETKRWYLVEFRPADKWKDTWQREASIQGMVAGVNRNTMDKY